MARKPYTWAKVKNGDIISFHYETKRGPDKGRKLLRTILVINKLFRKNKVGGDVTRLLICKCGGQTRISENNY